MRPTTVQPSARRPDGQQQRKSHAAQPIHPHGTGNGIGRLIVCQSQHVVICGLLGRQRRLEDSLRQRWRGKRPHGEEGKPAEELDHTQFDHDRWHALDEFHNFCQSRALGLFLLSCPQHLWGVFSRGEHGDQNAGQEDGRANGKRHIDTLRQLPRSRLVGHAQLGHKPRQIRRNPRANANDEGLQHKSITALRLRQFVRNQCAERLHAHIDAGIEDPQESCRHPEFAAVRHEKQRNRTENGPDQKEGATPSPPRMPRVVAEVPDNGLHQKPRQRGGNPKHGNLVLARAKRLKYP